jgi:hypothetical protein
MKRVATVLLLVLAAAGPAAAGSNKLPAPASRLERARPGSVQHSLSASKPVASARSKLAGSGRTPTVTHGTREAPRR